MLINFTIGTAYIAKKSHQSFFTSTNSAIWRKTVILPSNMLSTFTSPLDVLIVTFPTLFNIISPLDDFILIFEFDKSNLDETSPLLNSKSKSPIYEFDKYTIIFFLLLHIPTFHEPIAVLVTCKTSCKQWKKPLNCTLKFMVKII